MAGHGSKLGRRKEAALAALLSRRTIEEAAREAAVSSRTLLRWMKLPEFRDAWLGVRRDCLTHAMSRLQHGAGAAVSTLLKAIVDPSVPASRVRAAQATLALAARGVEIEDLDIRIAQLEQEKLARDNHASSTQG